MGTISSFRELRVYQAAFRAANTIFQLSKGWPADERYELTSQVRRSSRSVCANVVEAWRKRRYPAAFVAKLSDAEAEAAETQFWLDTARECGYLSDADHRTLDRAYEAVLGQLVRMIHRADDWTVGRPQSPSRGEPRSRTKAREGSAIPGAPTSSGGPPGRQP